MRNYDPSDEPRGYHRIPAKTRNLQRFSHTQNRNRTLALTECVATMPDGSQVVIRKSRTGKATSRKIVAGATVTVHRRRAPKYDIGTILIRADALNLDIIAVRDEYRHRVDNGYSRSTSIAIETNATFRGGDH